MTHTHLTDWQARHGPDAWAANPWVAACDVTTHNCIIERMERL